MANYVQLSKTVAKWLLQYSKNLVEAGIGQEWHPTDTEMPELMPGGFLDVVDIEEVELHRWTHALVHLARVIGGILAELLKEDMENIQPLNLLEDID